MTMATTPFPSAEEGEELLGIIKRICGHAHRHPFLFPPNEEDTLVTMPIHTVFFSEKGDG